MPHHVLVFEECNMYFWLNSKRQTLWLHLYHNANHHVLVLECNMLFWRNDKRQTLWLYLHHNANHYVLVLNNNTWTYMYIFDIYNSPNMAFKVIFTKSHSRKLSKLKNNKNISHTDWISQKAFCFHQHFIRNNH